MTTSDPTNSPVFRFAKETEARRAGEIIFADGQAGQVMYGVKEGTVDVVVHGKIIETVGPGGFVGEMALIDQHPRSATVVAKTDCVLVPIDEHRFMYLVQQTPFFALDLMRILVRRLRTMDDHI